MNRYYRVAVEIDKKPMALVEGSSAAPIEMRRAS